MAVSQRRDQVYYSDINQNVIIIQRSARRMLARLKFRKCLYKLIFLKNIIDKKLHKEKIQTVYAFEQFIINTEEHFFKQEFKDQLTRNDSIKFIQVDTG